MKIGIVGGGAVGLLFASYLSKLGNVVTIYTRSEHQASHIARNDVYVHNSIKPSSSFKVNLDAQPSYSLERDEEDLYIIAVKQYDIHTVLPYIAQFKADKPILFIQNGMKHLVQIQTLPNKHLYVATVEHGVLKTDSHSIEHTGIGVTKMAAYRGDLSLLVNVIGYGTELFKFTYEEDYEEMLLKKYIANVLINPLTAILRVENGKLLTNPFYYDNAKQLFAEAATILQLSNREVYFQNVMDICENTSANRSSMLRDLEENRQTEIDAILGYLIEKADSDNKCAPISKVLYQSIKGMEFLRGE